MEVCQGGSSKKWAQSISPRQSSRCITFEDDFEEDNGAREPCPFTWEDMEETRVEEDDLEGLSPLNLHLEGFLAKAEGGTTTS